MSLIKDPTAVIQEKASKLWEEYGRDFLQTHPSNNGHQDRWQQAAVDDLTYQYNRVSKLHILGRGQAETLEKLYTQVYLLRERDAFERYGEDMIRAGTWVGRMTGRAGDRQDGLALAAAHPRLYILGQPGAGKTTVLKRIALSALAGDMTHWPMFVPLVEVAQANQTILDFITAQFDAAGFANANELTRYLLQAGGLLLLLDGLDEVPEEQNQGRRVIQEIQQLSDRYAQIKLLLTCRIAAASYQFTGFRYAEMAEFKEPQMERFVHHWFGPGQAKTAAACFQALRTAETLKEIARTPLLLTLLCIAYHPEKGFPRQRAGIYQAAIDGLLQEWDRIRGVQRAEIADLRPGQIQELLAYVAYQTFLDGHQLMEEQALIRRIESYCQRMFNQRVDGRQQLKQVEANTGLLVERSRGVYAFAHLTLHEYLTAWWIIEKESWDKFQPFIADSRWREVLLLMTELSPDGNLYLTLFLDAMQQMVADDNDLVALLQWGAVKSTEVNTTNHEPLATCRAFFIFLVLHLDRIRARAHARARALDLALNLDPNRALDLDFDLGRALDLDRARTHDHNLDDDCSLALILARNLVLARAFDLARALNPAAYHAFALVFDLTHFLLNSSHLALGLDLDLDAIFIIDPNPLSGLVRKLDHVIDRARNLDIGRALVLARACVHKLSPHLALDHLFSTFLWVAQTLTTSGASMMDEKVTAEIRETAAQLDQFCHDAALPDLQAALATLPLPTSDASDAELQTFAARLEEIARTYRDLGHEWNLSEKQVELLEKYLQANLLFVECLHLAYVPDRAAIENQILLPP